MINKQDVIKVDYSKYNINKLLDLAEEQIKNAKCLRRKYGAVLIDKDHNIVSTGYNSAPNCLEDCERIGKCKREELNVPHGERYELCRSIHAEQRCIIGQALEKTKHGILFLVGKEHTGEHIKNIDCCEICKKIILEAGIDYVVFRLDNWASFKIIETKDWKI